jgi:hypothetical protein
MKKLKRWIARKIGAVLYSDLPFDIQQDLLNRATNKTIDFWAKSLLNNGFSGELLPPSK